MSMFRERIKFIKISFQVLFRIFSYKFRILFKGINLNKNIIQINIIIHLKIYILQYNKHLIYNCCLFEKKNNYKKS